MVGRPTLIFNHSGAYHLNKFYISKGEGEWMLKKPLEMVENNGTVYIVDRDVVSEFTA